MPLRQLTPRKSIALIPVTCISIGRGLKVSKYILQPETSLISDFPKKVRDLLVAGYAKYAVPVASYALVSLKRPPRKFSHEKEEHKDSSKHSDVQVP